MSEQPLDPTILALGCVTTSLRKRHFIYIVLLLLLSRLFEFCPGTLLVRAWLRQSPGNVSTVVVSHEHIRQIYDIIQSI